MGDGSAAGTGAHCNLVDLRRIRSYQMTHLAGRQKASRPFDDRPRLQSRCNATIALDQSESPAPTSVICGAFSKTAALMPTRRSATAAASPPMPPPWDR